MAQRGVQVDSVYFIRYTLHIMKGISKNINHLLLSLPKGAVITSSWLASRGVNYRLQHHYANETGLLSKVGGGAYVVRGNEAKVEGALYALNSQLCLDLHVGAVTALGEIHNVRHFVALGNATLQIFTAGKTHIPAWFTQKFGNDCYFIKTRFLTTNTGKQEINFRGFTFKTSSPERAILEAIFLCKHGQGLKEIAQIMETLTNLRPAVLQKLLENCSSIKVKRIFLYLADAQRHSWFDFLDLEKISLGAGKRVISPSGKLDKKFLLVIDDLSDV
ncbi:MAG: type IV toxin-antitoxin system AbiEi family antitoxin [Holosporales bacterium]|jgi:hypothetical protein|nr:type IV toxin-antitoxin system AbiEi family antitoxin [Holosporales bacterium]